MFCYNHVFSNRKGGDWFISIKEILSSGKRHATFFFMKAVSMNDGMEKGAHEVEVNDEQTGAEMEKRKKKNQSQPGTHWLNTVKYNSNTDRSISSLNPIPKLLNIVGGLHTQVSSPTLSNLPC